MVSRGEEGEKRKAVSCQLSAVSGQLIACHDGGAGPATPVLTTCEKQATELLMEHIRRAIALRADLVVQRVVLPGLPVCALGEAI
jgi:hypothetical protein